MCVCVCVHVCLYVCPCAHACLQIHVPVEWGPIFYHILKEVSALVRICIWLLITETVA